MDLANEIYAIKRISLDGFTIITYHGVLVLLEICSRMQVDLKRLLMFTTDRLVLRAYRESDRSNLLRLRDDPLVQRSAYGGYIAPQPPKVAEKLEEIVYKVVFYAIIESKDDGTFIGQCQVDITHPKNRDGLFGISLLPEFWDKGFGTEVMRFVVDHGFKSLALHRMSLNVWESNKRAIAVYKKIGFVEEGRKRKANWVDGAWEDVCIMGLLQEEWAAMAESL